MGGAQDEGALLLATVRDERSVRGPRAVRLGLDLPPHGTYCQIVKPRMDAAFPGSDDLRDIPGSAGLKLAAPLEGVP